MRTAALILRDIQAFAPERGDWRPLDALLAELWAAGVERRHLHVLFGVFERYPHDDGRGVLWSIVHGVESLPFGYELELRQSLERQRSDMGAIMLDRLTRSGAA